MTTKELKIDNQSKEQNLKAKFLFKADVTTMAYCLNHYGAVVSVCIYRSRSYHTVNTSSSYKLNRKIRKISYNFGIRGRIVI